MSPPLASSSSSSSPTNENLLLGPALDQLVTLLVLPLLPSLSSSDATLLRSTLSTNLSTLFAPTWQPSDPVRGSGFRSLIASKGRLPRPLREAAGETRVVSVQAWEAALGGGGEWQAWCDPGRVSWREGGWEWEDGIFYLGGWKDTLRTIWAAPTIVVPSTTPRLSHAITIRPPSTPSAALPLPTLTTLLTPPTPQSEPPLPPLSERPDSPLGSESSSTSTFTSTSAVSTTSSSHPSIVRHGHSSSISSMTSSSVDNNNHSRTRSSSPTKKPSVTAYDGGKVGVLGGGVKLGGGGGGASVPSSPKKQQSSYTLNNYLSSGQQQQQRGRKIGRQPGLMGPPTTTTMMGLFAYRG
ncbi:hypothetical protein BDY24DRAFT_372205 [Mrakia frigida]|uniref:uncharacterized protein n=1 Tax=Mrakia frigida TaxID=29902 RepID=UPI003FCBEF99